MVQYNSKEWIRLIFHNYSRNIMKSLIPMWVFIAGYTGALVYVVVHWFEFQYESKMFVHSLLGIVLGLFLVFRTNSAYDRWWEGRKKWGELVNNSRVLAQKIHSFLSKEDKESRNFMSQMISNFVFSTKEHLRENFVLEEMQEPEPGILDRIKGAKHKPNLVGLMLYERANRLYKEGKIEREHLFLIDKELKAFIDVLGACERIKNTPIPYSYNMFIKQFIFIFTVTLPWGIAPEYDWWTIPIVLLLFSILASIEMIAEEIEDPFGTDVNDLPVDSIANKIKNNIEEIFAA
jgi:putative membrane protein